MKNQKLNEKELKEINNWVDNVLVSLTDQTDYTPPFINFEDCDENPNIPGAENFHKHIINHELQYRSSIRTLFNHAIGRLDVKKDGEIYVVSRSFYIGSPICLEENVNFMESYTPPGLSQMKILKVNSMIKSLKAEKCLLSLKNLMELSRSLAEEMI